MNPPIGNDEVAPEELEGPTVIARDARTGFFGDEGSRAQIPGFQSLLEVDVDGAGRDEAEVVARRAGTTKATGGSENPRDFEQEIVDELAAAVRKAGAH